MRKNDKKIFLDKRKLTSLLNLRLNGFSLTSLAYLYSCDVMTILYRCRQHQVEPQDQVYDIQRIIKLVLPSPQPLTYKMVNGERINLGKSYKEYLF